MLVYILKSDFRSSAERDALLRMILEAGFPFKQIIEIPATKAPPAAYAFAVQLRQEMNRGKQEHQNPAVMFYGSIRGQSCDEMRKQILDFYGIMPHLAQTPCILLVRKSEWDAYEQVKHAAGNVPFFSIQTERGPLLCLPQSRDYATEQATAVRAHLRELGPKGAEPSRSGRDADQTLEMIIDGRQTGSMKAIPESAIPDAYPQQSEAPKCADESTTPGEDRITELPPPPSRQSGSFKVRG